ncbi:MAG: hypothetical protein ACI94Y_000834 [Maribacter sp.]|jgi:hypothetical protein
MLKQYYPYIKKWKTKLGVMLIFIAICSFIILFLEPFKTSESRKLTVEGYSLCVLVSYLAGLFLESYIFAKKKIWQVQDELLILLFVVILSAISVYWYDLEIIKKQDYYWDNLLLFSYRIILPFSVLLVPLIAGLRRYYGQIFELPNEHIVTIQGASQSEFLEIDQRKIYYIKSSNNYVEIKYIDEEHQTKNKLIRCTLSQAAQQVPDFLQCHRSYIVNPLYMEAINGTQKKAFLQLKDLADEIPISKSYYSMVKTKLHSPQTGDI